MTVEKQEIERRYFADEKDFRGIEKEVNFVVNNDTELDECIDEILFDILYYENPQSLEDFLNKLEYVFDKANETDLADIQ